MSGFRGAEAPKFVFREELSDGNGAILMNPVGAPCRDDHVAAIGGIEQSLVIFRAVGVASADHLLRIGGAKAEYIGHQKSVEALAFGKPADASEGGIELLLIGRARVEPDPHDQTVAKQRIDLMQQRVAVVPIGGEVAFVFQGFRG